MNRILPAYPLFVKDPYFSIWAQSELLNQKDVIFWTGDEKKLYGYLVVGGKRYCFLGDDKSCGQAEQTALSVTAFTTDYRFTAGGAELSLSFVSPLPPDDLSLTSCPVCYVKYSVAKAEDAQVIFMLGQSVCHNQDFKPVRGGTVECNGYKASFFGLKRQLLFSDDNDRCGAEWGFWYLSGEQTYYSSTEQCKKFLDCGSEPAVCREEVEKSLVSVNRKKSGIVMLGFDDVASINYFGDILKGYYLDSHTVFEALDYVFTQSDKIDKQLAVFDKNLCKTAKKYGEDYINILYASLRQSVGAHKLVKDREGNLLFLSKECYSNGCLATVDVSYPSIPLYLLYNPELVKAMLRPVFKFANMPVWRYDFAPHDIGTYPNACGQVYGTRGTDDIFRADMLDMNDRLTRFPVWQLPATADVYEFENQMPVEESGNMLVMLEAVHRADGDLTLAKNNFALLEKWVEYLVKYGLKPENQLCTDDFSGHFANNINLAIKATVGIACFAELCKALGKTAEHARFRSIAEDFAREITGFSQKFTHLPLTWDCGEETYGLKYNLAFDKILGLKLFPAELLEREIDFYLTKLNKYGVPLDSRAEFTKSDWLMWVASLTDDGKKIRSLTGCLNAYLKESEDRLPFGDWYETKTGRLIGFRNRTVQGGCFILLLGDKK